MVPVPTVASLALPPNTSQRARSHVERKGELNVLQQESRNVLYVLLAFHPDIFNDLAKFRNWVVLCY